MDIKALLLISFFYIFSFNAQSQTNYSSYETIPTLDLSNPRAVIPNMSEIPFDSRCTAVVEGYLKTYFVLKREHSKNIIGKSVIYFPLFEKLLKENNAPDALKYLAITESALKPRAISRVGAGGLWQFMPETGRHYGLNISTKVDDRFDPEKSTRAAIQYLKKYHAKYGDWALAIASYNSGPGRVRRAIKRSGSKNFWRLKKFLPRETRSYVPGFIAAAYLMKYYDVHGIKPNYPSLDFQITESTTIHHRLPFHTIAKVTGVALDIIRDLNPAYLEDEIPAHYDTRKGYNLVLPKRVMGAMRSYLSLLQKNELQESHLAEQKVYAFTPSDQNDEENYYQSIYTVGQGENLVGLAKTFNTSLQCILAWNNLVSPYVMPGKQIKLFQIAKYTQFPADRKPIYVEKIPQKSADLIWNYLPPNALLEDDEMMMHIVKRGESLLDIIEQYPNNSLKEILETNNLSLENPPSVGMKIRIRK